MARELSRDAFCGPCIDEADGLLVVDPLDPMEVLVVLEVNCARHEELNLLPRVALPPAQPAEWWGR